MKNKIIFGILLVVTMLIMLPSISAVQFNNVKDAIKTNYIDKIQNISLEDLEEKIKDNSVQHSFNIALLEWKSKNYSTALKYVNAALKKIPPCTKNSSIIKIKLLKIEILLALKKKNKVLSIMSNWLKKFPHDYAPSFKLYLVHVQGLVICLLYFQFLWIIEQDPVIVRFPSAVLQ